MSTKRSDEQQQESRFAELVNILSLKYLDLRLRKLLNIYLIVVCAIVIPVSGFLHLVFEASKQARGTNCLSNVKDTAVSMLLYACDWQDVLPRADNWADDLRKYRRESSMYQDDGPDYYRYQCPLDFDPKSAIAHYAFFEQAAGKALAGIKEPASMPLVFETNRVPRNKVGNLSLVPDKPRHLKNVISYADGHAKRMEDSN